MDNAIVSGADDEGGAPAPVGMSTSLLALAALASRLGMDVTVEQMRRRFALEPGEPDTATLIAIARELGLEARAVQMTFKDLPDVARSLPAILRARDGGALILEEARSDPAKGTVAIIRDPSATDDAVVAIDELHLAEVWEGEAILVKRRHATERRRPAVRSALDRRAAAQGAQAHERHPAGGLVGTVFAIAPAFVMRIIVDRSWLTSL